MLVTPLFDINDVSNSKAMIINSNDYIIWQFVGYSFAFGLDLVHIDRTRFLAPYSPIPTWARSEYGTKYECHKSIKN